MSQYCKSWRHTSLKTYVGSWGYTYAQALDMGRHWRKVTSTLLTQIPTMKKVVRYIAHRNFSARMKCRYEAMMESLVHATAKA